MSIVSKAAGLAIFLVLLTVACGGGSSPATGGAETKSPVEATGVPDGESLSRTYACVGCHTVDGGSGAGPTWLGLYGKEETLDDGTTVTVDEAYLRESIVDPNAKVVKDFLPNMMPGDFGDKLTDPQLDLLIEYIKSLK